MSGRRPARGGQSWWQALPLGPTGYGNSPYQSLSSFAGNAAYDWDAIRRTGYRRCIDRLRALLTLMDAVGLDDFRGFAAAGHVPTGAATAQSGQWVPGPGAEFFSVVQRELGGLPFIAEDLGLITPDVSALRDQFQLPGTRVLQFAFDGHSDNPHLPVNYTPNSVVCTGTYDNPTTREWCEELPAAQRQIFWRYPNRPEGRSCAAAPALTELAWSSRAALAIVPLQDVLNLGAEARMNVPGPAEGNWRWRCPENILSAPEIEWLRDLTKTSNRSGVLPSVQAAQ
jgi:4-alpha-glucanotransferase